MKTEWTAEQITAEPHDFERVNPTTWIQRRNIQVNPNEEQGGYTCESRFISNDVYEALMETLDSPAQALIMESFANVTDNQATDSVNQVTLMEALADIYTAILEQGGDF